MRRTLCALALAVAAAPASAANLEFFTIGAGPVGGGYYTASRAICDIVHATMPGELRCSPDPTPGSVYNAIALAEGQLDFAIVQSDTHDAAVNGTGPFAETGPNPDLRSVLSLYAEPLTLVARREANVEGFSDLAGKRVNLGPRNSGTRATSLRYMDSLGVGEEMFAEVRNLPTGAAIDQLCAGDLDAVLLVVGHPNATVARALGECDSVLVPITGPAVEKLVAESPDYALATIPGGTYPGQFGWVRTFSVTATLMTRSDVDPEIVATVARIIVENLPELNRRAPVIPATRTPGLTTDGLSAPLYDGVAQVLGQ
jgi:TRAP transporter TAXI family solute receptor